MLNSLDLLIVAGMGLAAASLLALALMFLLRNHTAKRVSFYAVSALGVYLAYVGMRIHRFGFALESGVALVLGLAAVAAVVLDRVKKGNASAERTARIMSAVSLVFGFANALL